MNIRIKNNLRKRRPPLATLRKKLEKLLRGIGFPDADLSIVFIGDRAMRSLNSRYRGKNETTDVLSFSLREGRFPHIQPEMLGDIVISLNVAARQARESGHSFERELELLLVHGLAHLLGYDHERSAQEARRMKRKEQWLLERLLA